MEFLDLKEGCDSFFADGGEELCVGNTDCEKGGEGFERGFED